MNVVSDPTTVVGAIAFSDIVGFTELTADHGDDVAVSLVDRHEAIVSELLGSNGRIVKQLGDGLLLFFSDARIAVDTMLATQHRADIDLVDEIPLWLRSGVHWGAPRTRGSDLIGHDVNLASRITSLASPGELLVTEALVQEIGDRGDQFARVGPVFVKGVTDPVRLWRALPALQT